MKYFWPAVSIILLILVVGGAAYYFGTKSISTQQAPTIAPTTAQVQKDNSQNSSLPTPTPTQTKTYEAGGILVFKAYTLKAPLDWTVTREKNDYMDNLTLTKLGYKLVISQAAGGGGGCIYPGDAPAEMAQSFASFAEIANSNGFVFRRGQNESSPNTYTVCQKNTTDGSFGFPTNFGNITLTTPGTSDKSTQIFFEVDTILTSINKK